MDDALDVIERRIDSLESKILPQSIEFDHNTSQTIIDLLLETQTMISSALSGRHLITTTIENLSTLNSYLDPDNGNNQLEIELQRQYILEIAGELQERLKNVDKLKQLLTFMNSEYLMIIGEFTDQLKQLTTANLSTSNQCQRVTNQVLNSIEKYNSIMTSIKIIFSQLDRVVSDLENRLKPKTTHDE